MWRLASQLGLAGSVCNIGGGLGIQAWGSEIALAEFIHQLSLQAPPLAEINQITVTDLETLPTSSEFIIAASLPGQAETGIPADAAICKVCLAEVFDASNRRYRYPFTGCTHCGPRFSIISGMPYDRSNTAMAGFQLCTACQAEYQNPGDRRFHDQVNACPDCGPQLWLEDAQGNSLKPSDPISACTQLLSQGYIVAIKGIGGFHLACDAADQQAVARLRSRKQRDHKPFAIMGRDIEMLSRYVQINAQSQALLSHRAAPIVILKKHGFSLAAAVAPDNDELGCLLPYTALHHLLMQTLSTPIVLTSGNRSEAPQCLTNREARQQLAGIADFWLLHNRDILNRLDDSVLRVMQHQPRLLRRTRGYVPQALSLPAGFSCIPPLLALGGELKNTFCLLKDQQAILSQHSGDLENAGVQSHYRQLLKQYRQLFVFQPQLLAVDRHPGYLSSQYGREWAAQEQLPLLEIQHHHAHIAACMAEHGLPLDTTPVLGVAMDGLGMGTDGTGWGGEFLRADYRQFQRLGGFHSLPLLGASQAMRQPWRNTYAHLKQYFDWQTLRKEYAQLDIIQFLDAKPLAVLDAMQAKNLNSPLSSSCGRCLDAFAAALGLCRENISYEGQAAIQLEALAAPVFASQTGQAYPYESADLNGLRIISWQVFWLALLNDLQLGVAKTVIAARIHHGMARAIAETALQLAALIGTDTLILTGGVFQNRLLLEETSRLILCAGKQALSPNMLPSNDGGLAFGQAVIAAALSLDKKSR